MVKRRVAVAEERQVHEQVQGKGRRKDAKRVDAIAESGETGEDEVDVDVEVIRVQRSLGEELLVSLLTPGVSWQSLYVINGTLLALTLAMLLTIVLGYGNVHVYVLLGLTLALAALVNWFMSDFIANSPGQVDDTDADADSDVDAKDGDVQHSAASSASSASSRPRTSKSRSQRSRRADD